MDSWNYIYFSRKRTYLCNLTSVRSSVIFKNHLTNCFLLILIYSFIDKRKPFFLLCKILCKIILKVTDSLFTNLLFRSKHYLFHLCRRYNFFNRIKQAFRNCTACIFMLRFTAFSDNLVNKSDNLLVNFMSLVYCFDHLGFRYFIGTCFNHDNFLSC